MESNWKKGGCTHRAAEVTTWALQGGCGAPSRAQPGGTGEATAVGWTGTPHAAPAVLPLLASVSFLHPQKPTLRAGGQRAVRNIHTASGSSWSAVLIFDLLESSCKLSSSVPRTSQGISLYTSPSCDSCLAWRWPDVGKHHMQHGVPAHCWSWLPTVMGGGPPGARATLPISCSSSMFVHTDTSRPLGPWSPQSPPM